jgi:hypothetical protein
VAMASAKYRVSADGQVRSTADHPFVGIRVTTVPKYGEVLFSKVGFLNTLLLRSSPPNGESWRCTPKPRGHRARR